jgi:hypothetical protein
MLDRYTWRWFTTRLFGLSGESRTWRKLGEAHRASADADTDLGPDTDWE